MQTELVEWQRLSPKNGMIQCWWTHPILDEIETWDWKNKKILEFGAGRGTAWLRERSKWVDSIEANMEWAELVNKECEEQNIKNGELFAKQIADGIPELKDEYFDLIPKRKKYDIVTIDGIYRTEAIEWAINHFKGRDGLMIIDNLDQDYVWISPKAMELIEPYESKVYIQLEHTNHEGKPWNTRWVKIPK